MEFSRMCQGSVNGRGSLADSTITAERARMEKTLARNGYRLTSRRRAIYDTLLRVNDHVCVEHILEAIEEHHSTLRVNKTTVYRALTVFVALGLVAEMRHADGRAQYELTLHGPHGHLLCSECGRVQDLDMDEARDIKRQIEEAHGFSVELMDHALPGIYVVCSDTQRAYAR
jgi:Fur family transcriptional regulator, ferric uptake regulator